MRHVFFYVLPIPLLGIALALGLIFFRNGSRAAAPLPLAKYLNEWKTLQGNDYTLHGQVDRQLAYAADKGQLLSVILYEEGRGRVPLLVPTSLGHNFETGQRYQFNVVVRGDLLCVESCKKL